MRVITAILLTLLLSNHAHAILINYTGTVTETTGDGLGYTVGQTITGTIELDFGDGVGVINDQNCPSECRYAGRINHGLFDGLGAIDGDLPDDFIPQGVFSRGLTASRITGFMFSDETPFQLISRIPGTDGQLRDFQVDFAEWVFNGLDAAPTIPSGETQLFASYGGLPNYSAYTGGSGSFRANISYSVPGPSTIALFAGLLALVTLRGKYQTPGKTR